jgi:hypothetical protein
VIALAAHALPALPWLLGAELVLLAVGFSYHQYLHRSQAAHAWALARLMAEVTRSVLAVGKLHVQLEYLFALPFPHSLRPLLRTINVLHLRSTRRERGQPWQPLCDSYQAERLHGPRGQLAFYHRASAHAGRRIAVARGTFLVSSVGAFLATLAKLVLVAGESAGAGTHGQNDWVSVCGSLAIVLPVFAVAALSLAGAFDLQARWHTFAEMHVFLLAQEQNLKNANSQREFAKLVLETESRLLGETANWFARRTFTGVA